MLQIAEIFKSIQGESSRAGLPCCFIRLAGCNLACSYCDTGYALTGGTGMEIDEIGNIILAMETSLVEVTGGEPLHQKETPELCSWLIDKGRTVLVETNGSKDISLLPQECIRIVDIKCPDSGSKDSFFMDNLTHLRPDDEIKFVISSHYDFSWAISFTKLNKLHKICTVLFSPNTLKISAKEIANGIIKENLPIRLNIQLHKLIWSPDARGV